MFESAMKENFCDWRRSSGPTEQAVQLRICASYRSLGLAFLFGFGEELLHKSKIEDFQTFGGVKLK